jgi:hypothetical protein
MEMSELVLNENFVLPVSEMWAVKGKQRRKIT